MTFSRPKREGAYGNKEDMPGAAAKDAWDYLVNVGYIQGSGYHVGQVPRISPGRSLSSPVSQPQSGLPSSLERHLTGIMYGMMSQNGRDDAEYDGRHGPSRDASGSTLANNGSQSIISEETPPESHGLSRLNPERLRLFREAPPIDQYDFQIDFRPGKPRAFASKNVNLAPLGPLKVSRPIRGRTVIEAPPVLQERSSDLRRRPHVPPQKRLREDNATVGEGRELSMRQSANNMANGLPTPGRSTAKSMPSLMAQLNMQTAPLARVDGKPSRSLQPPSNC
jgi:hypothetical protein